MLSLKLIDEFEEVAVTVRSKVLRAQVRQLILAFDDVVDADLALKFLYEAIIPTSRYALREDCRYG